MRSEECGMKNEESGFRKLGPPLHVIAKNFGVARNEAIFRSFAAIPIGS